jgi:hypothetical protein
MQYRRSVQGRMLLTELEKSARTESKRMTNHNTPQLSRMCLSVHCATFPWTVATKYSSCRMLTDAPGMLAEQRRAFQHLLWPGEYSFVMCLSCTCIGSPVSPNLSGQKGGGAFSASVCEVQLFSGRSEICYSIYVGVHTHRRVPQAVLEVSGKFGSSSLRSRNW